MTIWTLSRTETSATSLTVGTVESGLVCRRGMIVALHQRDGSFFGRPLRTESSTESWLLLAWLNLVVR